VDHHRHGPLLLLSLYYQQVQGKSAIVTGLILAPQGIGSLVPRTVAGKLADRIGVTAKKAGLAPRKESRAPDKETGRLARTSQR
jgi:hypothetical protein